MSKKVSTNAVQRCASSNKHHLRLGMVSDMVQGNTAIAREVTVGSHRTTPFDNILNKSSVGGSGRRVIESDDNVSRLDVDIKRVVAQSIQLTAAQKRRQEIEAQGEVVKDFMVGKTRIKINDAYCRDKTPDDVQAILTGIANRVQEQLIAQETTKLAKQYI